VSGVRAFRSALAEKEAPVDFDPASVGRLGLGCMSMSHPGRDEPDSIRSLELAVAAGITYFDTADRYGDGHNERLLRDALADVRDQVIIATKAGFVGRHGDPRIVDGRPEHLRAACEASLERLGTDRLDLWTLHRVDPEVPVEESVGTMAELVAEGKVATIGLCEITASTLRRAVAVHPIATLQSEYSLWARDVEAEVLPVCRELGVHFVAYAPLGAGFLTAGLRSKDDLPPASNLASSPRFDDEHRVRNLALVDALAEFARARGLTPAQVSLAWLGAQPGVLAIPGSARPEHLNDNLGSMSVDLTASELEELDRIFAHDAVSGERKTAWAMTLVDR
jgi:aryl-alcohol dehydrogenase-like predicted oxidoreductase